MPVIEALTYRKPVLVSDLPIFHEIAGDAVCYCKLDTEDAVPQLAAAMRQIGKPEKRAYRIVCVKRSSDATKRSAWRAD